jgi:uncharacterized membrane protein
MARAAGVAWKVLAAVGIVGYPVLIHLGLAGSAADPARTALLMAPMAALGCWLLLRSQNRMFWVLVVAGAAGVIWLLARGTGLGTTVLYGLPHAAAYLFMLGVFGRTLLPGREAIITRIARHARGGTMPPVMERYTRNLTAAWCVFFAAQLAGSALLLAYASLETWSLFINVLSFPLVGLMFALDYLYRVIRYRHLPQSSIATAIQAYAKDRASSLLSR